MIIFAPSCPKWVDWRPAGQNKHPEPITDTGYLPCD